jgi:hypothetical protein
LRPKGKEGRLLSFLFVFHLAFASLINSFALILRVGAWANLVNFFIKKMQRTRMLTALGAVDLRDLFFLHKKEKPLGKERGNVSCESGYFVRKKKEKICPVNFWAFQLEIQIALAA